MAIGMPSSRRKSRASGPSPSPARDRSPSPVAGAAAAEGSTDLSGGGVHVGTQPFKLRLELPRADDPHEPIRHTFCFFRSTSAAELGRTISAAFYGSAEHKDVAAVWEHPDDGAVDAEPLVHTLSGVIAHPELYTGKTFCLTEQARRPSDPVSTLDLICTEPAVEEPRPPPSLVEILAPLAPHPRRNPAMLLALALGAGALLSCDSRWQVRPDVISLDPTTYWQLTTSSRAVALVLLMAIVSGQLHSVLRDEGARHACTQLYANLMNRKLLRAVSLGVGVTICLWTLRVFDTAARLAIVGAAHCVLGVTLVLRSMMSLASVPWFENQLRHLAQTIQKLFLPLLEMNDYAAKQVYLHGPPSPILPQSLGFLDLPLDYATGKQRVVPESLRADFVICSDVVYSREVAGWLPQAALACLRPGGCLFTLLPLSRMGCRECLHQLGEIMTPFDPPGADPATDNAMAKWIKQHLGANQLGHRIYGFRAPTAEMECDSSVIPAVRPCEHLGDSSSAHSASPAGAEAFASTPPAVQWKIATRHTGSVKVHVVIAQLHLPLLDSITGADLRTTGRTLSFDAPPGCEYTNARVELPVDVNVDVDRCVASFSKRSRTLRVRLPVSTT
eukprot:COSAG02_NODE_714_length_18094_cov_13.275688_6_plen_616_part_00